MKLLIALALACSFSLPAVAQQNGYNKDKNGNWVKSESPQEAAAKKSGGGGGGGGSSCKAVSSEGCPSCAVNCPAGRTAQCQIGSGHCTNEGNCFCNTPPACRCL